MGSVKTESELYVEYRDRILNIIYGDSDEDIKVIDSAVEESYESGDLDGSEYDELKIMIDEVEGA